MFDKLRKMAGRWVLGKAIDLAEGEAEKAVAKVPQSKRTTFLGVCYLLMLIAKKGVALFDDDPTTVFNVDEIDMLLFGGGVHAIMTREQKTHDEEKKLMNRTKYISMILLTLALGVGTASAQSKYGALVGGSLDGDGQNGAGSLCAVSGLEALSVKTMNCLNMRGGDDGAPIYDFSTILLRPLVTQGKLELLTGGGGGLISDTNSTSGMLEGTVGAVRHDLWRGIGLGALMRGTWSPGNDLPTDPNRKFALRFSLGLVYEPD